MRTPSASGTPTAGVVRPLRPAGGALARAAVAAAERGRKSRRPAAAEQRSTTGPARLGPPRSAEPAASGSPRVAERTVIVPVAGMGPAGSVSPRSAKRAVAARAAAMGSAVLQAAAALSRERPAGPAPDAVPPERAAWLGRRQAAVLAGPVSRWAVAVAPATRAWSATDAPASARKAASWIRPGR